MALVREYWKTPIADSSVKAHLHMQNRKVHAYMKKKTIILDKIMNLNRDIIPKLGGEL